jgi:hypothetical protein
MLVYSRRDTAKPESVPACFPTVSSDHCSILQPWVQTTIFDENENFEASVSIRQKQFCKSVFVDSAKTIFQIGFCQFGKSCRIDITIRQLF